jgi:hypothetical protein
MEDIELKIMAVDNPQFLAAYTKSVVDVLRMPRLSAEVREGEPSEALTRVLESLGYQVEAKKRDGGWVMLKGSVNP